MTAPLHFEEVGRGDPPIVLVPGWCCDLATLAPTAKHLSEGHRVISVDLPGHGQSAFGGGALSMSDIVAQVRATTTALGIEKPVLIGHSLGGRLVLAIVQADPGFAAAAVLLDSVIDDPPANVAARRAELEGPDWETALSRRFSGLGSPQALVDSMLGTPRDAALAVLVASDEFDAAAAVAACRVPLLYIGAPNPRAEEARLQELNPRLVYRQVAASGHFVQLDAAPEVNAIVDTFLGGPR
jgi:pimeloyl-ACP methyl ester carboxylesterase